ncbi:MAG: adenylylsulfate kinase [Salibacteraceae bacterium]|jgi:adenylylsulfate kinase
MAEKLHIIPHNYKVSKADRNQLNGHSSKVIWVIGLSGSGKSTISNVLEQKLLEKGVHTYLLDGDNVRKGLNSDLDFSMKSRSENIRRVGEVSKLMVDAGTVCIVAFITPLKKDRDFVKSLIGKESFIEVFVDCPVEVCESRDVKGLYAKARNGEITNFTGVNSPFEPPENPDVLIESDKLNVSDGVNKILDYLEGKL